MKKHQFLYLDCLRGVAALCVVIYHITQHNGVHWLPCADVAVDIFFVLSGFVMAHSYSESIGRGLSFPNFITGRLIRLYPMFIVGLVIGLVAIGLKIKAGLTDISFSQLPIIFFINSTFLPYISQHYVVLFDSRLNFEAFPFSPSHWSLFFELFAYICFYFITRYWPRLIYVAAIAGGLILCALAWPWGTNLGWGGIYLIGGFPKVAYGFFAGVLVYKQFVSGQNPWLKKLKDISKQYQRYIFFIMPILLVLAFSWPWVWPWVWPFPWHSQRLLHIVMVALSPLIVFIGASIDIETLFWKKFQTYLGFISYPIYCIHFSIMHLFDYFLRAAKITLNPYLVSGLIFAISIIAAILLGKYFDAPVRARLKSWLLPVRGRRSSIKIGEQ